MRHHLPARAQPCHRPKAQRDDRNSGQIFDHDFPARYFGNIGETCCFEGFDRPATPSAFNQADQRQAIFMRQLVGSSEKLMPLQLKNRRASTLNPMMFGSLKFRQAMRRCLLMSLRYYKAPVNTSLALATKQIMDPALWTSALYPPLIIVRPIVGVNSFQAH